MAKKTLKRRNSRGSRKTRGARKMRGGALQNLMPAPILGAEAGADATLNIAHVSPNAAVSGSVDVLPKPSVSGSASASLLGGKRRKSSKKKGKKRKVNGFFSAMIKAKNSGASSFSYNGKTYKKHTKGHLVYYKA